jgi:putative chitinase
MAPVIDAAFLHSFAPKQSGPRAARQSEIIDGMAATFSPTLDRYEINTPLRIAHFIAQIAHESDGFCTTEEYASGRAYENRLDLGNDQPGDGPLFKGRGLIQITGRSNYRSIGQQLGLDLMQNPGSVNDPYLYLLVSCVFWQQKKINAACDADDIIAVTRLVNGGLNGLDSRKAYLATAKAMIAALGAQDAAPGGPNMPVLHRGSAGDAVAALQRQLVALGYKMAIDGSFGPATEQAVRLLQSAAGVPDDGIVGADTWAKLSGAGATVPTQQA